MYNNLANDLIKIFNEHSYLSIVLDNSLKTQNLNEHDKKVYTKILYGVVERKLLIDYYLQPFIKGVRVKPFIKNILRIGCYVIDYMNIKDYFIVNELVQIVKKKDYKSSMFVNAVLRNYQRTPKVDLSKLNPVEQISLKISLPQDITNLLYKQYKESLESFFIPKTIFNTYRINTLKTTIENVSDILTKDNYDFKIISEAIIIKESLLNHELFKNGLIIAQDLSSIKVGNVVNPHPYSSVLDTCSAPGGKSLHMASIMNNTGSITSCDIYDQKLDKILENAKKLGVTNITTLNASAVSYDYGKLFDYVLCDVPCSGLGVINHKPDLKYNITLKDITDINNLQKQIIKHAASYVKDGGILVYSTCTINKFENEWLIKDFLNEFKNFKKLEEHIILPTNEEDGFYICKLQKGERNE